MHKLYYPSHIGFMLKSPLYEKQFFVPRGLIPRRTTFKSEYLREFKPEFEIVLGYESGAHMGSIHEKKNQRPKISCYYTFKLIKKVCFTLFRPEYCLIPLVHL
jgi:hypothetical protein